MAKLINMEVAILGQDSCEQRGGRRIRHTEKSSEPVCAYLDLMVNGNKDERAKY